MVVALWIVREAAILLLFVGTVFSAASATAVVLSDRWALYLLILCGPILLLPIVLRRGA